MGREGQRAVADAAAARGGRHVTFGNVRAVVLKRMVGTCVVPESGTWPLGLSRPVVDASGRPVELALGSVSDFEGTHTRNAATLLIEARNVRAAECCTREERRALELQQRAKRLPKALKALCNFETRAFDAVSMPLYVGSCVYSLKSVGVVLQKPSPPNPLFHKLNDKQRRALLAAAGSAGLLDLHAATLGEDNTSVSADIAKDPVSCMCDCAPLSIDEVRARLRHKKLSTRGSYAVLVHRLFGLSDDGVAGKGGTSRREVNAAVHCGGGGHGCSCEALEVPCVFLCECNAVATRCLNPFGCQRFDDQVVNVYRKRVLDTVAVAKPVAKPGAASGGVGEVEEL